MPHETGNIFPTHQPKTGERNGSRVQREIRTMRSQIQREIRTVRSCREWGIEVWGEGASTDQQAARNRLFTHRLSILVQPVCQTELKNPSGGDVGTLLGAVEHTLHRVRPAALPRRPGLHGERLPVARGSSQVRYPCDGEIPYEKLRRKHCTDLGLDHQVVKNFAFSCAWLGSLFHVTLTNQ